MEDLEPFKELIQGYVWSRIRTGELNEALDSALIVRDMQDIYTPLGILYDGLGNTRLGLSEQKAYHLQLVNSIVGKLPSLTETDVYSLCLSFMSLGRLYMGLADIDAALEHYHIGYALADMLCAQEASTLAKLLRALLCQDQGELYIRQGAINEAFPCCLEFNELMTQIIKEPPANIDHQNKFALSYLMLGNCYYGICEYATAVRHYSLARNIIEDVLAHSDNNAEYETTLALVYERLGMSYGEMGDYEQALHYYQHYCSNADKLAGKNPENTVFTINRITSLQNIGFCYFRLNDNKNAKKYFDLCLEQILSAESKFPDMPAIREMKGIHHQHIGNFYARVNDTRNAGEHYLLMFQCFHELNLAYPRVRIYRDNFAYVSCLTGLFYHEQHNVMNALLYYRTAQLIWTGLVEEFPEVADYREKLKNVLEIITEVYALNAGDA